jgi:predicted RNA methylase
MGKQINFGDTIFILNIRIRMIRDLLILDADPDFFLDKTLSDLEFINAALGEILKELLENTRLIDRNGQFRNLHETERQFAGVLWDLANGSGALSVISFPALREKVGLIRELSLERQKTLEQNISVDDTPAAEPIVSSAELNELLREF